MQSLSNAIQKNSQIFGNNCENLGKYEGSGIYKKKLFITYDRDAGWNYVKLNLLELFLRKAFGFFQSTHLDTVARGVIRSRLHENISKIKIDKKGEDDVSKFDKRIHDLWTKTYKSPFPENVVFDNTKHSFRKAMAEVKSIERHTKKQYEDISKLLPDNEKFNPKNEAELDQKVNEFIADLPEFFNFFNDKEYATEEKIIKLQKLIEEYYNKIKTNEKSAEEFKYLILSVLVKSAKKNLSSVT